MTEVVYMMILFKDWDQSRRVIDRLDGPNVSFLIHIDRKTGDDFVAAATKYLAGRANCHFVKRESVHWGAWGGLVQAQLNGARYVEAHGIPCDVFIYMSGQDYPLRSNEEIAGFFAEHPGKQFLENFPLPTSRWPDGGMDRVKEFHFQVRRRHVAYPPLQGGDVPTLLRPHRKRWPIVDRKLPGAYAYHGGSAAIILSGEGVSYLNSFVRTRLGRRMIRYFKTVRNPDEIFFQTVFLNSELRDTVIDDELRYIDWNPPEGFPPKILRMEDFEKLRASGKLFARKFSSAVDIDVLDALDAAAGASRIL